MNKNIYLLIVLSLLFSCNSTKNIKVNYKNEIASNFTQYLNFNSKQDYEKSVEYIVDDFFKIIPKKTMIEILHRNSEKSGVFIKMKNPKIINIGNEKNIDNKNYSLISYSVTIEMKSNELKGKNTTEKKRYIDVITQNFGAKNVKFIDETSTFEIYSKRYSFAISKNGKTDWKFLAIDKNENYILEKIIPKDFLKKTFLKIDFEKIRNEISKTNLEKMKKKYPNFNISHIKIPISEIKTKLERKAEKINLNSMTEIIKDTNNTCGFIKLVGKGNDTLVRVKYIYLKDKSKKGKLATEVISKYNNGKSFSDLALKYSKDGNATKSGDLGWMKTKILAPDFVKAIKKHNLNEVFITNTSAFGWYVIKKTHNIDNYKYIEIIKVTSNKNCR